MKFSRRVVLHVHQSVAICSLHGEQNSAPYNAFVVVFVNQVFIVRKMVDVLNRKNVAQVQMNSSMDVAVVVHQYVVLNNVYALQFVFQVVSVKMVLFAKTIRQTVLALV